MAVIPGPWPGFFCFNRLRRGLVFLPSIFRGRRGAYWVIGAVLNLGAVVKLHNYFCRDLLVWQLARSREVARLTTLAGEIGRPEVFYRAVDAVSSKKEF